MNHPDQHRLHQLAHDLHEFAAEVHTLGYSPATASGAEGPFLDLSARMRDRAATLARLASARSA
ncbi:hypothetical protein H7J07_09925 [Mycobacterium koreense]|uniref:Uncharacterized protein n=1 Tax=Mycolicibacillus koreensis TaxID=1069220 RepID=A0A7I7SFC3_9MYCO|nr:hypothetical protein [Mycolicibacillus koreensis]MCV7248529.1 hypothetical protein [Mycolicibacillus koreensis]ODR11791.1 hypothetical protein BHQ15_00925 [Mycolicibacillus koreensis]OSC32704.1 hypothetical protein B8W67_14475 [Mycolicibacillus koreensis]BBY55488.1 hypothetical protein MKOR_27390 [Mycolicibacillus koreensis]